ncbi:MAG: mobilization protein MbpA [Gillisia sp.]
MKYRERNLRLTIKEEPETKFVISKEVLKEQDAFTAEDLDIKNEDSPQLRMRSNSRCVPVGTKMIAPGGRKKKKMFKEKRVFIKFRCSVYEKKLLLVKAKRSGLSLSEYIRRVAAEKDIKERLSEDHLEIYKSLVKFHNNFKSIGNMFRKKNPGLSKEVYKLAEKIKLHLQKIEK